LIDICETGPAGLRAEMEQAGIEAETEGIRPGLSAGDAGLSRGPPSPEAVTMAGEGLAEPVRSG
jgi:hypothetical protein